MRSTRAAFFKADSRLPLVKAFFFPPGHREAAQSVRQYIRLRIPRPVNASTQALAAYRDYGIIKVTQIAGGRHLLKKELLDILRCPACVAGKPGLPMETGVLQQDTEDKLICRTCSREYTVKDGIPDMTLGNNPNR